MYKQSENSYSKLAGVVTVGRGKLVGGGGGGGSAEEAIHC